MRGELICRVYRWVGEQLSHRCVIFLGDVQHYSRSYVSIYRRIFSFEGLSYGEADFDRRGLFERLCEVIFNDSSTGRNT